MEFDYFDLVLLASKIKENAYAPYSKFRVGAVVISEDGSIYTGVNVENSSFGATICAERSAIAKAITEGKRKILAIVITSDSEGITFPCGICRQVLIEFGNENMEIICSDKNYNYEVFPLKDLYPNVFDKIHLDN